MNWLWSIISGAVSGLVQGVLALFGMSDAQKLGRLQIQNQQLKEAVHAKAEEARVMEAPARPELVVDNELLKHAGK